jgi:peptidoglycan/LPS O-acetylase OafA/YrhL
MTAPRRAYLDQLDLVRVLTFFCVVWIHVLLYTAPGASVSANALVTLLHFTRETFFALTAFVLCYSQHGKTLIPRRFWRRRFALVLPAYITWNLIYAVATEISTDGSALHFTENAAHNLATGYWHLYFVFVMMQLYALFPALWWLLRVTRGHHIAVFVVSLLLEIALLICLQYNVPGGAFFAELRNLCRSNRLFLPYQLYILAGALAGMHFTRFHAAVTRHRKAVALGVLGAAAATIGVYEALLHTGDSPGAASTIYQPIMVLWNLAIAVGLYALGTVWKATRQVKWASDASFGVYLSHPLVLFYLLPVLGITGSPRTIAEPWDTAAGLAITLLLAGGLTALAQRTPLAKALTGRPTSAVRRSAGGPRPAARPDPGPRTAPTGTPTR